MTREGGVGEWCAAGALAVTIAFLGRGHPALREDELECEEAFAHLADCCGKDPPLSCEYVEGCGERFPDLSVDQSKCVRRLSCNDIVAQSLCSWQPDAGAPGPRCE